MKTLFFFLGLLVSTALPAAEQQATASACVVVTPRHLASSDYVFDYQGACKNGKADGRGRAVWRLRLSPQTQVVWEGVFSQGVYVPAPAQGVTARAWDGDSALFDLGVLPAQAGVPAPRLKVHAVASLTNYPDPCQPRTLWVVNAPAQALVSEDTAQAVLQSAVVKLKARCGDSLSQPDPTGRVRSHLDVRVVATPDLALDRWGNVSGTVVRAPVPLSGERASDGYNNQAALQQRQQQQRAQDQDERQATLQRLRGFFQTHQAQGWARLVDIEQNPFRYADRVVVTMAQLDTVISPTRALVQQSSAGWRDAGAVLDGQGIAQWRPGARLLAVRVLGRMAGDDKALKGWVQLQLLGSEACTQPACSDWLRLPFQLQDGQVP